MHAAFSRSADFSRVEKLYFEVWTGSSLLLGEDLSRGLRRDGASRAEMRARAQKRTGAFSNASLSRAGEVEACFPGGITRPAGGAGHLRPVARAGGKLATALRYSCFSRDSSHIQHMCRGTTDTHGRRTGMTKRIELAFRGACIAGLGCAVPAAPFRGVCGYYFFPLFRVRFARCRVWLHAAGVCPARGGGRGRTGILQACRDDRVRADAPGAAGRPPTPRRRVFSRSQLPDRQSGRGVERLSRSRGRSHSPRAGGRPRCRSIWIGGQPFRQGGIDIRCVPPPAAGQYQPSRNPSARPDAVIVPERAPVSSCGVSSGPVPRRRHFTRDD